MAYGKLPEDYRVDALAREAEKRARQMGRPDYSYGKLVADTTEEERETIAEEYKKHFKRKYRKGGTKSFFPEADKEGAGD